MSIAPRMRVLVVARDVELRRRVAQALEGDTTAAFGVEEVPDAATAGERLADGGVDVAFVRLQPPEGLGAVRDLHAVALDAPLVALLATGGPEASEAALRAGAVDTIGEERLDAEVLRRTARYAIERGRLRAEVHRQSVVDAPTGVFNSRGFEQLATHHLRMADRSNEPVVLVFVRVETSSGGHPEIADALARDTARILREAVRDADVVGRLGFDTFGVLLSGGASGNEGLVLSRLVEAVATRDARTGTADGLSLWIGSATYDAEHRATLPELIRSADERMRIPGSTA